jgi:adenine-specific DNA methylase
VKFIGDFANWELSTSRHYLDIAHALIGAAHGEAPVIVDPFGGGGAIPLEGLRLGCDVFASDLNPVSAFVMKVMLEDIPRCAPDFLDRVETAGASVRAIAQERLAEFYPSATATRGKVIAYLWARTVRCESPNCGAEIPIYRSQWLSRRGVSRARYFREASGGGCVAMLIDSAPRGGPITFRIAEGYGSETPRDGYVRLDGTKASGNSANVICPCCRIIQPGTSKNPRVPTQLAEQAGGADATFDSTGRRIGGARMIAVVTQGAGNEGRSFRLPEDEDYIAVATAQQALACALDRRRDDAGLSPVPDEPLPRLGTLGFRVQRYGILQWGQLFTARQKLALLTLCEAIEEVATEDTAVREILALALSRLTNISNSLCWWRSTENKSTALFSRQAIPFVWDFVETPVFSDQAGDYHVTLSNMLRVLRALPRTTNPGQVQVADACASPLADETAHVWFTDPPYYDAVPYSDLSDFFFVWLKRAFPGHPLLRDPFDATNPLTPKAQEAVQDETKIVDGAPKGKAFFETVMGRAFSQGRRVLRQDGIGCVVFAHKTTEGWEALLSGMIRGGWVITGSWPIATERSARLRARDSAALATSVHLVCRPRSENAPVGDWGDVLRELPRRVGDWLEHLQAEGVRGADLVFACIGPAIEIYSRYSNVVDAQERDIPLGGDPEATEPHMRGFLAYVWEVIGRMALEQILGTAEARARNGAAGAVEEDARLTALFLWTLQATDDDAANGNGANGGEDDENSDDEEGEDDGETAASSRKPKGFSLVFDVVRRFAQPLGIRLPEWEGRIIATEKGLVRLLPVSERAQQLFGKEGASAVADQLEQAREPRTVQLSLFVDDEALRPRGGKRRKGAAAEVPDTDLRTRRQATTLDRVHAAMLLHSAGRANALRALLQAEVERSPDFVRLSNSLSALYPRESEEKRLLDAMLLAVPR